MNLKVKEGLVSLNLLERNEHMAAGPQEESGSRGRFERES